MKEKILITGSQGYLGKNLTSYFNNKYDVFGIDIINLKQKKYYQTDITNKKELIKIIDKIKPDVIIHLAALHNLKACEANPEESYKINCQPIKDIVAIINKTKLDTKLIFLSSDYVFKGDKGYYCEDDKLDPITVYGKNKKEAEEEITKKLKKYAIIRTAAIFGKGGNNFYNFIVDNLQKDQEVDVFNDTFFSPTYIDDLAKAIEIIIDNNHIGIFHIAGCSVESRYTFAKKIAKYLGYNEELIKPAISLKEQIILTNSSLSSNETQKKLGIKFIDTDTALKLHGGQG